MMNIIFDIEFLGHIIYVLKNINNLKANGWRYLTCALNVHGR